MSKRNAVWLGAVILVGASLWLAFSIVWGIVGAIGVLVASEIIERSRRRKRRAARGAGTSPSVLDVMKRQRPRRDGLPGDDV